MNVIDPTATIGEGTVIWHYAIVLADVTIGPHCSIGSLCEVGRGSVIGHHTRLSHGVFLPPNSLIGHRVFIGPCAVFTDDRWPRVRTSDEGPYEAEPPIVEDDVSIGAGAVILPGVRIGTGAVIGAGAIVSRDVPPSAVIRGEPARARLRQVS